MTISRRRLIVASILAGVSLIISKLIGFLKINPSFASNNMLSADRKRKQCRNSISRVISVHSDKATRWDSSTYPFIDSIDQDIVEDMLNKGIKALTEEKSVESAWRCIFESYKDDDVIAIKPNFVDLHKEFKDNLVVSPSVINAILKGLIEILNVSPNNIAVYDCTSIIPDSYRKRIKYPVRFVEPYGSSLLRKISYKVMGNPLPEADFDYEIKMSHDIKDKNGKKVKCYLPQVVTTADHIINIPVLKSHQFILASGALKNHYGTVRFSDGKLTPEYLHPPLIHESIADINSHPQLREKTRLVVMDGLFGRIKKKGGPPDRWIIYNNENPNRLFLSMNPVALDSVTAYCIKKEIQARNGKYFADDYLRISSERRIGTYEMPDESGEFKSIDFRHYDIE